VKIRIGFGLGTRTKVNGPELGDVAETLEKLGFDSLWLSERISGEAPDPIVGMAFAAARTTRLKFGTSVLVLPGRNPVVLAKELATLDRMSAGRLLPAFGLGVADSGEQQAFGVERKERAAWFDEALPLLRRLWLEDAVTHDGPRFHLDGVRVLPKPRQQPPDVWLGGIAPSELRRVGRLGDGWLPSFVVPGEVAAGRAVIEEVAAAHGRSIDPEHYGVLVAYSAGPLPEPIAAALRARRADCDPGDLIPSGFTALRERIQAFVADGASKFVVLPIDEPGDGDAFDDHLAALAGAVLDLET
jgi:probable F420-dependent oxidoreductase